MLSGDDLKDMRDAANLAMPDQLELLRDMSSGEDEMGGRSEPDWQVVGTSICALSSTISQSALVGPEQRTTSDAVVTIPGDSPLEPEPDDRIQVVGGHEYEVQGYAERSGRFQITKRMLVARIS
jgi:hypothetical protein